MPDTQEHRVEEAQEEMGSTAREMEQHGAEVGQQIDDAKQTWSEAKSSGYAPAAAGDWEDTEPEDSTGEDATGFDDPESVDLDDEDLEDDDGFADEDDDA